MSVYVPSCKRDDTAKLEEIVEDNRVPLIDLHKVAHTGFSTNRVSIVSVSFYYTRQSILR